MLRRRCRYHAPSVASVEPALAPAVGALVTINGANFGAEGEVELGDRSCTVVSWQQDVITCRSTLSTEAEVDVSVTVGGQSNPVGGAAKYVQCSHERLHRVRVALISRTSLHPRCCASSGTVWRHPKSSP